MLKAMPQQLQTKTVTIADLSAALGLSQTIIQKSAVRTKSIQTNPCLCIPSDRLALVLHDLKQRYPANRQAIEQEMPVEEATRQYDVSLDTNTLQAGNVPCIMSSALVDYSGAEFNNLPLEIRDTTVHAMKEADYNSLTYQYSILCDSGWSDMGSLWTAFVLKLHREDGYYPKLPIRVRGCIYGWQGQLASVLGVR